MLCDCQQQVAENPGNNGQPATERSFSKQKPDEVFAGSRLLAFTGHAIDLRPTRITDQGQTILTGYPSLIFQPPRVS